MNFPLLADSTKKLTEACGVLGSRGYASRVTFVINGEGKVAKIYDKVTPSKHAEEVYKYVKENLAKKK